MYFTSQTYNMYYEISDGEKSSVILGNYNKTVATLLQKKV